MSVMITHTPGTKATGINARDALEQLDSFQAATFRSAVGLIRCIPGQDLNASPQRKRCEVLFERLRTRLDAIAASGQGPQ